MSARHPAGFTLVELTIVVVVIGISAGLVIPNLTSLLAREGEKSATRVLAGALRRARSEALLTGRPWRVEIDWGKGECRIVPNEPLPADPAESAPPTADAARDTTRRARAAAPVKTTLAPKKVAPIPPVKLPAKTQPRLALTRGESQDQPDVTRLVVRPEGLCQPAFIRLPGPDGTDVAVTVAAVGCRVDLAVSDLDAKQKAFKKAQGLADPPWAETEYLAGRTQ